MLKPTIKPTIPEECEGCLADICEQVKSQTCSVSVTKIIIYSVVGTTIFVTFVVVLCSYFLLPRRSIVIRSDASGKRWSRGLSKRREVSDERKQRKTRARTKRRDENRQDNSPTTEQQPAEPTVDDVQIQLPAIDMQSLPPPTVPLRDKNFPLAKKSHDTLATGDVAFIAPRESDPSTTLKSDPGAYLTPQLPLRRAVSPQSPRTTPRSPLFAPDQEDERFKQKRRDKRKKDVRI